MAAVEKRGEVPPRIMMVSSTTDFLSLRASLGRTGASGTDDQPLPANVRMYDIAGASHVVLPRAQECTLPLARLDWAPVSRATLVALDRWLATNAPPPASKLMPLEPRDRRRRAGSAQAPALRGDPAAEARCRRQCAGRRSPARHGSAARRPCRAAGAEVLLLRSRRRLPAVHQEQIARRYKGRDDYVNRIRIAARALQQEGLLLPEDAAVIIAEAAAHPWRAKN